MPLWGIVLLGLAVWALVSVVLGVILGRAVKIAETHREDQEFVRRVSRTAAPGIGLPREGGPRLASQ
jgi:hypothetical protein